MLDGRVEFGQCFPEGGVFGVAIEEDFPLGCDEHHAGNAVDLEESGKGALFGFKKPGDVAHARIIADAFGGGLLVFLVLVHADDDDVVGGERLVLVPQGGHEFHAGAAPRSPEVDQECFSALNEIAESGGRALRGGEHHLHVESETGHFFSPASGFDALKENLGLFGGFPNGFENLGLVGFHVSRVSGLLRPDVVDEGLDIFLGTEPGGAGGVKAFCQDLDFGQDLFEEGLVQTPQSPDEFGLDDLLPWDSGAGSFLDGVVEFFLAEGVGKEFLESRCHGGFGIGLDRAGFFLPRSVRCGEKECQDLKQGQSRSGDESDVHVRIHDRRYVPWARWSVEMILG